MRRFHQANINPPSRFGFGQHWPTIAARAKKHVFQKNLKKVIFFENGPQISVFS
jgi:hypothetical protein